MVIRGHRSNSGSPGTQSLQPRLNQLGRTTSQTKRVGITFDKVKLKPPKQRKEKERKG